MNVNGSHSTDERPKFLELWKIDIGISLYEQSELYGRMCRGKNTYSYALDKNIFWLHPRIPLLPVVQSNKWFIYSKIKVILSITQAIFEYHTSYKSKPRELFQASLPPVKGSSLFTSCKRSTTVLNTIYVKITYNLIFPYLMYTK